MEARKRLIKTHGPHGYKPYDDSDFASQYDSVWNEIAAVGTGSSNAPARNDIVEDIDDSTGNEPIKSMEKIYWEVLTLLVGMNQSQINVGEAYRLSCEYPRDPVLVGIKAFLLDPKTIESYPGGTAFEKNGVESENVWCKAEALGLPNWTSNRDRAWPWASWIEGLRQYYFCKNDEQAFKLSHLASEDGFAPAQCHVGLLLCDGKGVTKSETECFRCMKKAAAQGYAPAQYNISNYLIDGVGGVAKDVGKAAEWCRKAAAQGHARAMKRMGWMYGNGIGLAQSYSEANKWYRKEADLGIPSAQFNLGSMSEKGQGIEKCDSDAVGWFEKAARQGHIEAQFNLGVMHHFGRGTEQNDTEAFQWFFKAAEQGHKNGQNNLAWAFMNGRGTVKNSTKASEWFRKAAAQGHEGAKRRLENLNAG